MNNDKAAWERMMSKKTAATGFDVDESASTEASKLRGGAVKLGGARQLLQVPLAHGEHALNPSVVFFRDKLVTSVRVTDPQTRTTRTIIVEMAPSSFASLGGHAVVNRAPTPRFPLKTYAGFEDIRLFVLDNVLMGVGCAFDLNSEGTPTVVLLEFDDHYDIVKAHPQVTGRPEKNWMPLVAGGLALIYSIDPLVVFRYNAHLKTASQPILPSGRLRGSSQLVPYRDGYLAVVHERAERQKVYTHRFVVFDRHVTGVSRISRSFFFDGDDYIEFCCGLAAWRGEYILSYGVRDQEARLARVTAADIEALVAS